MNPNTVNAINLGVTTFSALCAAVATVATLITVRVARDGFRIQKEQNDADKPHIQINIAPTRHGSRQLAQIMFTNKSRRPAHIQTWFLFAANSGQCTVTTLELGRGLYDGKLPVVIGEAVRQDILVDLEGLPWQTMTTFGVSEEGGRNWSASPEQIKQFIETAERWASGKAA